MVKTKPNNQKETKKQREKTKTKHRKQKTREQRIQKWEQSIRTTLMKTKNEKQNKNWKQTNIFLKDKENIKPTHKNDPKKIKNRKKNPKK